MLQILSLRLQPTKTKSGRRLVNSLFLLLQLPALAALKNPGQRGQTTKELAQGSPLEFLPSLF